MDIREIKKLITKKHIIGAVIVLSIIGLVVFEICVILKLMKPSENKSPNAESPVIVSSPPVRSGEEPNVSENQTKQSNQTINQLSNKTDSQKLFSKNSPHFVDDPVIIGNLGGSSILTANGVHSEINGTIPNEHGPSLTEQIFDWVENKTINIKLKALDSINHSNYSFKIDIDDPKGRNMTGLFKIRDDELWGIGQLKNDQTYEIPIVIKNLGNSTRTGKSTIFLHYKLSKKEYIDESTDEIKGSSADESRKKFLLDGSGGNSDDEDENVTSENQFDDTDSE